MRLLADENAPEALVLALRADGHDVAWIRTDSPGLDDVSILVRARAENRILLTFDKDFGELAFRFGLPASSGIVLVRLTIRTMDHISVAIASIFAARNDWSGHFSVIEESRVRMTRLPQ